MERILSVGQLVTILNDTLELSYPHLEVEGEVVGFKVWKNRLAFFDLQDEEATINCMVPISRIDTPIEDGMRVRVIATPKVRNNGRLSIAVTRISPSGEGALMRAFQLLKERLEKEGIFASERKRSIPQFPETIGLITASDSAAFHDFIKTINQRWNGIDIKFLPVTVQGEAAPEEIVEAIGYFDNLARPVDTLILTRGGGSVEDLAVFNVESVVRAVAASRTPIVVGVGHEVDMSLADLAADKRAATPTDAAVVATPDKSQVSEHINRLAGDMLRELEVKIEVKNQQWGELSDLLMGAPGRLIAERKDRISYIERILQGLNPEAILRQGYAIVRNNGSLVRSGKDVKKGDRLMIQLAKDQIVAEVQDE